jgi:hypothetical protein
MTRVLELLMRLLIKGYESETSIESPNGEESGGLGAV